MFSLLRAQKWKSVATRRCSRRCEKAIGDIGAPIGSYHFPGASWKVALHSGNYLRTMVTPTRLSYGVLALTIALAGLLHLGAPLLVVLFSYFALRQLYFLTKRKWLALILFGIVVAGIAAAGVYFARAAILALPDVADTSIPSASAWAQKRQIELPFTDFESLRQAVVNTLGQEAQYLRNVANFAKSTATVIVFSILGIVAAGSLFYKTGLDPYRGTHRVKNNLYSVCCNEVSTRFRDFYRSFATVMGAQITISLINTLLTSLFLLAVRLPHAPLLIAITFLCGLVPIVGNLISNTIIVFVALTVSLKLAISALIFLVVIHKLEYLLNSKIIGDRIRNPVWLTLVALIIGERLMGIPGLMLAPVVLNYLRVEMLTVEVPAPAEPEPQRVESLNR
jgi:predicted PurR-regulated permease PerM